MDGEQAERILVFSKTAGFRHSSIEAGRAALRSLAEANDIALDATEDAAVFTEAGLGQYDLVVFLCTTGDVLDADQERAFERFIRAGGAYVGVHSASDTEYEWPWYGSLVGAYFVSHPPGVREGLILVADADHPATSSLPTEWRRTDEWYDFGPSQAAVNVLLDVDERTYKRAEENPAGAPRPIAWYHEFDGGRAFYTALGHTEASYEEPLFLEHLWGGIQWALGANEPD